VGSARQAGDRVRRRTGIAVGALATANGHAHCAVNRAATAVAVELNKLARCYPGIYRDLFLLAGARGCGGSCQALSTRMSPLHSLQSSEIEGAFDAFHFLFVMFCGWRVCFRRAGE